MLNVNKKIFALHRVFLSFIECYNYKVLNDPSRSRTYDGPSTDECDDKLSVDWYRFGGGAGNKMAESCVDMYHCNTNAPGWLNGSHPTVNEGAVQRRVCFRAYSDCCWSQTLIRVRNCGGFYVYQLKPVIGCLLRYCGNGNVSSTPITAGKLTLSFFFENFFFILQKTHHAFVEKDGYTAYAHMVKINGSCFSV